MPVTFSGFADASAIKADGLQMRTCEKRRRYTTVAEFKFRIVPSLTCTSKDGATTFYMMSVMSEKDIPVFIWRLEGKAGEFDASRVALRSFFDP